MDTQKSRLIEKLQDMFSVIFEDADTSRMSEFFDDKYISNLNGQRRSLKEMKADFDNRDRNDTVSIIEQSFIESENTVGCVYQVLKKSENGVTGKGNAMGVFTFTQEQKLLTGEIVAHYEKREKEESEDEDKYNSIYE